MQVRVAEGYCDEQWFTVHKLKIQGFCSKCEINSETSKGNGQVEATNKTILNNLTRCLEEAKAKWEMIYHGCSVLTEPPSKKRLGQPHFSWSMA